ncbi:class I SAM-dependent methyltransferase [Planktothrix sp. FACHB-1355]|uniref:Class I SAM-dependent methyltransferase n=1 Tax=Aerosakkonema funiforme FACHB-1375 TaxID=2949571 RepID=A0A926VB75_9CYAN|nr:MULTISPECIES: class I SAM-dependent methyltransferase [Oscillatoriales]MBD2180664.1 class I SAM-dependent methyltransferase [Aerosakkonema funiforme FACHB-1375]MBD3558978.1 class I SAM-dependent methyltransferase [Planktothrix sp. FACHB-1355]
MTATVNTDPGLASRLINGVLSVKPLAALAKHQARQMMMKRAEKIGVAWQKEVEELRSHDWESMLAQVQNPHVTYPDYYLHSFHAYDEGNLGWEPALEVEVAAYTVHSTLWGNASADGDAKLRKSYHDILKTQIPNQPQEILDIACSVGMSTFALQDIYPQAKMTGLDLSPYFLAVAKYKSQQRNAQIRWVHAAAESTNLPTASFDLVSIFLLCHELPQEATRQIFREVRRLLRPNGHIGIMDMNPKSEVYAKMPPYIMTLLKSTEPWFDEYFTLDIEQALVEAGFERPTITRNSPRHRTIVAKVS